MAGTSSRNDICATMPSDAERLAVTAGIVSGSSSDGPKAGNPKHHGCRLHPATQRPWRLPLAALLQQRKRRRNWPVTKPRSPPVQCPKPVSASASGQRCLSRTTPLQHPVHSRKRPPLQHPLQHLQHPVHSRRRQRSPLQAGIPLLTRSVEVDGTTWCGTTTSRKRRTTSGR